MPKSGEKYSILSGHVVVELPINALRSTAAALVTQRTVHMTINNSILLEGGTCERGGKNWHRFNETSKESMINHGLSSRNRAKTRENIPSPWRRVQAPRKKKNVTVHCEKLWVRQLHQQHITVRSKYRCGASACMRQCRMLPVYCGVMQTLQYFTRMVSP